MSHPTTVADRRQKPEVWERTFPVNGQGTLIFNTKRDGFPFFLSVEDESGVHWLALHVGKGFAAFLRQGAEDDDPEELMRVTTDAYGVDEEKVSYWYSYDRDNLVLKYGKGYRMEETTLMAYDFLKDADKPTAKKIRTDMEPYFNAIGKKLVRQYEENKTINDAFILASIQVTEPLVEFDKNPLVCNIPPKVLDSSEVTLFSLDRGDFVFSASLPAACKELYENIKGCKLNYSENIEGETVLLSDAIRNSIDHGILGDKLKEKQGELTNDTEGTYLRVTLGSSLGKSPGIPYVLEIWPAGHFSPVHNHGNANAVIKVLHGSLNVNIYNKQQMGEGTPKFLQKHEVHENDVIWIDRNWYQTHKLHNIGTEYCATIQCYKYAPSDMTYWPYFDFINDDEVIEEFFPTSDFNFLDMRTKVMAEYANSIA